MDSRRLVVWISTGILAFQGLTLSFDLLNCTAFSWIHLQQEGLQVPHDPSFCIRPQGRIDDAVNQGLSILAGLALGSSALGGEHPEP
jgi:hypothetical protein